MMLTFPPRRSDSARAVKTAEPADIDLAPFIAAGDAVMWGQAAGEPLVLTRALLQQREQLGPIEAFIGASWSDSADPAFADHVRFRSYCGAGQNRRLAQAGVLDILPCPYSQLPVLIRSGQLRVDVLMLQLAPADAEGRFSLSLAHEYLIPALDVARVILAEVNEQAPWTYGTRTISAEEIDLIVHTSRPPLCPPAARPSALEQAVAVRAAALIEDGATLQCGLGSLPAAILMQLADRRDLGVHTGAWVDPMATLARAGVISNARKSIDPGKSIAGVIMGGSTACNHAHLNPGVGFRPVEYTHSAAVLANIRNFVAINSALEVDLSGQINAEVAGGVYLGAVGGAGDFLRGARVSQGGLPIVALPSVGGSGEQRFSRIVAQLSGPVSTSRSDAAIIVTEHGVADLRALSLSERRERMLALADPSFRESLERAVRSGSP
jgi:acyl-CoA hydrolase